MRGASQWHWDAPLAAGVFALLHIVAYWRTPELRQAD